MKTLQLYKSFLLMVVFAISVVSCEKTSQPTIPPKASVEKDMVILDNGPVSDTARAMRVVFLSQDYTINNSNGVLNGTGANVKLTLFSNRDGYIPTGNYTYATTKLPFTYDDATFEIPDNSAVNGVFVVYNGTLSVVSDGGTAYAVIFNGLLSNGYNFSATYNGTIKSYIDNY